MPGLPQIELRTNDSNRVELIDAARTLLTKALPPELQDDRFDFNWELEALSPMTPIWSSVAYERDTPVGLLAGKIEADGTLILEALYDPNLADPVGVLSANAISCRHWHRMRVVTRSSQSAAACGGHRIGTYSRSHRGRSAIT